MVIARARRYYVMMRKAFALAFYVCMIAAGGWMLSGMFGGRVRGLVAVTALFLIGLGITLIWTDFISRKDPL